MFFFGISKGDVFELEHSFKLWRHNCILFGNDFWLTINNMIDSSSSLFSLSDLSESRWELTDSDWGKNQGVYDFTDTATCIFMETKWLRTFLCLKDALWSIPIAECKCWINTKHCQKVSNAVLHSNCSENLFAFLEDIVDNFWLEMLRIHLLDEANWG